MDGSRGKRSQNAAVAEQYGFDRSAGVLVRTDDALVVVDRKQHRRLDRVRQRNRDDHCKKMLVYGRSMSGNLRLSGIRTAWMSLHS
jgi:hypothetical protein